MEESEETEAEEELKEDSPSDWKQVGRDLQQVLRQLEALCIEDAWKNLLVTVKRAKDECERVREVAQKMLEAKQCRLEKMQKQIEELVIQTRSVGVQTNKIVQKSKVEEKSDKISTTTERRRKRARDTRLRPPSLADSRSRVREFSLEVRQIAQKRKVKEILKQRVVRYPSEKYSLDQATEVVLLSDNSAMPIFQQETHREFDNRLGITSEDEGPVDERAAQTSADDDDDEL